MKISAYCRRCQKIQTVIAKTVGRSKQFTCRFCGEQWTIDNYGTRKDFSIRMQLVAIRELYPRIWPNYSIIEVDTLPSELAKRLDIGGVDKILFADDGHILQIGQRFRESNVWDNPRYRDFTIREAELKRHLAALRNGGNVPAFYSYGYATEDEKAFRQFYVVKYRDWLEGIGQDHRPVFKETFNPRQENFYYEPWTHILDRYVYFTYPSQPKQPMLF